MVVALSLFTCLYPCTIVVDSSGTQVNLGKNLDWPVPDITLFYIPADEYIRPMESTELQPWKSRFACLTVNQFGCYLPLGGINEQGLIIESTAYSLSNYPMSAQLMTLNEFEWIQYHLSLCSTTEEVIQSAKHIAPVKWFIALHYMVTDASGHTAFIEWINGELQVYTYEKLPYSVQVNNSYSNSLKYLGFHKGFGGDRQETLGCESPERFVRAVRCLSEPHNGSAEYVFNCLLKVKQPDTQWTFMYQSVEKSIACYPERNSSGVTYFIRNLASLFPGKIVMLPLYQDQLHSDNFQSYSLQQDFQHVQHVFDQLIQSGDIDPVTMEDYLERWYDFQNKNLTKDINYEN